MTDAGTLKPAHLALAVAVMMVWGSNFVVVKHALAVLPPLTLAGAVLIVTGCIIAARGGRPDTAKMEAMV